MEEVKSQGQVVQNKKSCLARLTNASSPVTSSGCKKKTSLSTRVESVILRSSRDADAARDDDDDKTGNGSSRQTGTGSGNGYGSISPSTIATAAATADNDKNKKQCRKL
jgi:hypothetical protein